MGKLQLKLKKKEEPAAAPAGAPAFAMPAAGGSSGMILELRGATVHIQEVVIKQKKK